MKLLIRIKAVGPGQGHATGQHPERLSARRQKFVNRGIGFHEN